MYTTGSFVTAESGPSDEARNGPLSYCHLDISV